MTSRRMEPTFAVRLVCAEFYQTSPVPSLDPVYSEFRGAEIQHVPVIRIFGSTRGGEKTCLHVHGVFPYLYVPCTEGEDRDRLGYRLAASLDAAINVSLGSAAARNQHVFKVQLISGMPFYGYHEKEHQYFKVYFYNPAIVKRAANLLQNGAVLTGSLQPHEAHIPYVQQFMIDYNLHGMSMVELRRVKHRLPCRAACLADCETLAPFTDRLDYLSSEIRRQSTCKLEADVLASDILNRQQIEGELTLNPGLAAIWEEEKARRLQLLGLGGGDSQLVHPSSPARPVLKPTANDIYQRQRLAERLSTLSQNDGSTVSTDTGRSQGSYPLETEDNSGLINASCLEHHIGPQSRTVNTGLPKCPDKPIIDQLNFCSSFFVSPAQTSSQSLDSSVLDSSDAPLLDILIGLADENIGESAVDDDSLLGSQGVDSETTSKHSGGDGDKDDDDDNDDLNLTLLQLNSSSFSQRDRVLKESGNLGVNLGKVALDGGNDYDYLSDSSVFDLDTDDNSDDGSVCNNTIIPQCDGAGDLSSGDSDIEPDVTIDTLEKRICDYKSGPGANRERVTNVAPEKRELNREEKVRVTSETSIKNKKSRSLFSPTSVYQSPKRTTSLNDSKYRMSRAYSPLSVIVGSPSKAPDLRSNVKEDSSTEQAEGTSNDASREIITDSHENSGNNETDEENICNLTFTQYLDTQIKLYAETTPRYKNTGDGTRTNREIVIVPRFNPPDFDKVTRTMEMYDIPMCRNENPFFGNHADVTNRKEVAHKLLRVPSKSLSDLSQFTSDLESITGTQRWRAMKVKEVYPSEAKIEKSKIRQRLSGQNKMVIVPLALAPLPKTVKTWLRAKEYLRRLGPIDGYNDDKSKNSANHLPVPSEATKPGQSQRQPANVLRETDSWPCSRTNASGIDPSLENALHNQNLYNDVELSRQLGISCGQIDGSSQANHFKIPCENLQDIKPLATYQYLTILCLELHMVTRGDLLPDPQHDAIRAIFYAIQNDAPPSLNLKSLDYGVLVCDPSFNAAKSSGYLKGSSVTCPISYAVSEEDLFEHLLSIIDGTDPDILVGWELESLSWGYLFQRAATIGINLAPRVSRIPCIQRAWEIQTTELNILTEIKMPGRIVLDIWRIMRHEIALQSYTFENMMYHVMHQRLSCPSFAVLTRWWECETPRARSMVVEHYIAKVVGVLKLIQQLDIIGKTTEFARLYGIQFFEVFSRGSQFQVESVMLRLAKPSNYVPVSPSVQQRATMRAPESLPLIMEPESVFYSDPLIVLDFQSLYPSIIIAHNYCFSTCLGRIESMGQCRVDLLFHLDHLPNRPGPFEFGATSLKVTKHTVMKLEDKMNFSPCGVAFVKPEVRVGILPRMLTEYLDTRMMVKKAMKDHSQSAHALQRALYSRQRGLKLLANVTFGYTHANFSGRMPCIEIGDSIVSKARETLERAIKLVETTKRWNARVVYGDTDSLFVLLPGRSRKQAFQVGAEISSAVTVDNPKPMKLKLEKIMQPAILQTKKRYCGYMYESPDQEKPVYLAKGIETVRRDGCPAVSKMLEKTLRILFDTRDVSQVKRYVTRQLDKVLSGRVSIQDLTFAKEFRGLQGYKSSACVPALELTRRLIIKDPRAIPRTSERVPYVIVAGAPNQPLFQCVRSPRELIADTGLRPNALYYTTRVIIPPLNRCLNLLGVDVNAWFEEMPHRHTINCNPGGTLRGEPQKSTISQYFATVACATCGRASNAGTCTECLELPHQTIVILHEKIRQMERSRYNIAAICHSCVGQAAGNIECESLDCPVLYRRVRSVNDQHQISYTRRIIVKGNSLEL